jgi:hypothetical protein
MPGDFPREKDRVAGRDGRDPQGRPAHAHLRDHTVLVVEPDERYEAFHVTGSLPPIDRGFSFVAVPGRGLARL